jgi:hypothetical protein
MFFGMSGLKDVDWGGAHPATPFLAKKVGASVRHMAAAAPVLRPALWTAARDGLAEEVLQLLAEEVDIEERGGASVCSPLHVASAMGHDEVVLLLLEHGAEVSARNNKGGTPLHYACRQGHHLIVRFLLHTGADLQSRNNDGWTPEDLARVYSHPQVVAMLQAEALRREEVHRTRCVAFAMGHHERLGAGSRVRWLDAGVVRMVLERV